MFKRSNQWRILFLGCMVLALAVVGCSSSKSRVGGALNLDTDLQLTFSVAADTNPDQNDNPSPVIIRLYELRSTSVFDKSDFVDIYERDQELLGGDLVGKQIFRPMVPGEAREENFVLSDGTTHVALYAEFSQYRGSAYKVVFPVTRNNVFSNKMKVNISGNRVALVE